MTGVCNVRENVEVVWLAMSKRTVRGPSNVPPLGAEVTAPKRSLNFSIVYVCLPDNEVKVN